MLESSGRTNTSIAARLLLSAAAALLLGLTGAAAARAAAPGALDPSFGAGGNANTGANTRLFGTAVQSNGDVLAVGESGVGSNPELVLARFTSAGGLDPSFGSGGIVHGPAVAGSPGSLGRSVAVEPSGQIVVAGEATDSSGTFSQGIIVERFNANGSVDTGFGSGGVVKTFPAGQAGNGYALAVEPNGQIVATGTAEAAGSGNGTYPRAALERLNSNGSLDTSFGSGGGAVIDLGPFSSALAVALQANGDIVFTGSLSPGLQVPNAVVARLTPSGALDPSFAGTGFYAHQYAVGASNSMFNAVAIQPDGKIVAAGAATAGNSGAVAFVARFTSSGAPDGAFGAGGVVYAPPAVNFTAGTSSLIPGANGVTLAPNGDIVAAGVFANGITTYASLWAFTAGGAVETSFGASGVVLTNSAPNNSENAADAISPTTGDVIAVGDSAPVFGGSFAGTVAAYGGFGAPKPPPPSVLVLSLKSLSKSYKTATVVKGGLKLTASCNEACSVTATLTVSAATARKLHLKTKGKAPVTIASGKTTLPGAGSKSITLKLKLSKSQINALEKQKSVGLTLQVTGTSGTSRKTIKKGITFKR